MHNPDPNRAAELAALRAKLAAYDPALRRGRVLGLGDGRVDGCFPRGGLPLGCWHELTGEGIDLDAAAVTAAFTARLCGALASGAQGQVLWVLRRDDLYAPGLAELGLTPDRLILVRTTSEAETLAAVEDCLSAPGVLAAVGEVEQVDLIAARRLQLACERRGATGLMVCRRLFGRQSRLADKASPAVAASRWRVGPAPSAIETDERGEEIPGLGPPRWTVRLERARGGRSGGWIMEACDGAVPFRVAGELADHGLAPPQRPGGARGVRRTAAG